MARCLIVANQTIGGDALTSAVEERIRRGIVDFVLAVPQVPVEVSTGPVSSTPQRSASVGVADGRNLAEQRLAVGLDWLAGLGATGSGEVVPDDAVAAVSDLVEELSVTEVVVSTLPRALSRFLRQDLASKLGRVVTVPIEVVTAAG
ncbi:MAG: hypothetical protein AAFP84_05485 [Actinomycetota bacterium]